MFDGFHGGSFKVGRLCESAIMGTELVTACFKEEDIDFPAVPPGFESCTSFNSKRVENIENEISYSAHAKLCEKQGHMKTETDQGGAGRISRSLRRRLTSEDNESGSGWPDQKFPVRPCIPKGIIRGCSECPNCQKVSGKWCPGTACRPDLEDVPVFCPNEEEFQDPIKYIASIRPKAEPYGICRIVPPPSWKPPCLLKEKRIWESSRFATRMQRVDKLQNRDPTRKLSKIHNHRRKKRRICSRMGIDSGPGSASILDLGEAGFGFEPGPEFTLDAFQRYADDFKEQYFRRPEPNQYSGVDLTNHPGGWEPSVDAIEGEYWRVVEKPTEEIEVIYGADVETGVFGSGFPKFSTEDCSSEDGQYLKSGWNLNNLSRLPGSVLSYESADISGVHVPWLYIGMCFSSFCWHVEDHHLYSLNYMHFGAPKIWYGVPGKDADKLEGAMRKHLPDLFEEQPDLLHKLVTQLSPSLLKLEGVPVYRCIQKPGEFVLTFPRAYHSGFNCGFNCAEAVNLAPLDWFPHGQIAVELYREQGRKTTISHDKLLLGAAREAVKANWELNLLRKNTTANLNLNLEDICGRDGILAKSLRARMEMESARRGLLCKSSRVLKMECSFDAITERECSICFYDLHLSAAGCCCSPDKFACLNHVKQLCPCAWGDKFLLFRYDIADLNFLVEAVEGKLSAVYRWARLDLGLALSSYISKETSSNLTLNSCNTSPVKEEKLSEAGINFEDKKACEIKPLKDSIQFKKEGPEISATILSAPPHLKGMSHKQSSTAGTPEVKKSTYQQADVICLSDDEDEQSDRSLCDAEKLATLPDRPVASDQNLNSDRDLATNGALVGKGSLVLGCGKVIIGLPCSASAKDATDTKCGVVSISDQQKMFDINKTALDLLNIKTSSENIACRGSEQIRNKVKNEIIVHRSENKGVEDVRAVPGSPSCGQNNLDKYYRQKGPRIAKVLRQINFNVEPLEFGVVLSGKLWSSSHAIFPKGFKSRVKYIDISDPTNMSFYVSEIMDGGEKGPLFMVSLEHCQSEIFVHVSPSRCWEMVRERVLQEISKHHKLGRMKLPPLEGLQMFGFTSPAIIRGIEALDKNRICREYWNSRPLAQTSGCLPSKENCRALDEEDAARNHHNARVKGLLKKANPGELHSLLEVLSEGRPASADDHGLLIRLLREEIQSRSM
ncbi:hypothetical protein Nepgr_015056 [Nepenthes gracilis]|uniref:Lysine-specific demethylase JMJ16 n=1 Tax=Nepenthes gracilis TaxID=150966 RepID=A0AAD3XR32_NEPGR|nr:hypothetical protein Nepgr_015056 [Nepenthes gracilis]